MCGVTGWVSFDRDLTDPAHQVVLRSMTETLRLRGPDGEGVWSEPHAALGHRRLAIIDLESGQQPMTVNTPGGRIAISYSGETYNFRELRRELVTRGHLFRTDSDTEVVLRGYLEWGAGVSERLRGIFAFGIWDGREQRLTMSRDHLGVKPLSYSRTPDGVVFGSEAKALFANPLIEQAVDLDGLRDFFGLARNPGVTIWKDVVEVRPGTTVTVDANGLREHTYWRLETRPPEIDDQDQTIELVRSMLDGIVAQQMVADVPLSTLLSGGLDSSFLSALAARHLGSVGEQLRTHSLGFTDHAANLGRIQGLLQTSADEPFAREAAAKMGSLHSEVLLSPLELSDPRVRDRVIAALEMPMPRGQDSSLLLLLENLRRDSKVVLVGEGADELFGGYTQFFNPAVLNADGFPWLTNFADSLRDERALYASGLRDALDLDTYLADSYRTAVGQIGRLRGESDHEFRMRQITHLHMTRFVRHVVDRAERIGMAVGVEVRVPYLDHELVNTVYNTPWSMKFFDGREKSLLRSAAQGLVPDSVLWRPKSPYPTVPHAEYVAKLQAAAREVLASSSGPVFDFIDADILRQTTELDPHGMSYGLRQHLYQALTLNSWLTEFQPALDLASPAITLSRGGESIGRVRIRSKQEMEVPPVVRAHVSQDVELLTGTPAGGWTQDEAGGFVFGRELHSVRLRIASRNRQPIEAGVLLEQAAIAPLLPSGAPVIKPMLCNGADIQRVVDGDDTWYLMYHERIPGTKLAPPYSLDEYRLLLEGQDAWTRSVAGGPIGYASWRDAPVPFDGLDSEGNLVRISEHLPTYPEWRENHLHKVSNFERIASASNLQRLVEQGLNANLARWVNTNARKLHTLTMRFHDATAGDHLVNGMLSSNTSHVVQTARGPMMKWLNFGQLTVGHPFANYMFGAIEQHQALFKEDRISEWPRHEQLLLEQLAGLEELGAPVEGWQLKSFVATYLGQFIATGLRELPREVADPAELQREWFDLAESLQALSTRWDVMPDGPLDPDWSVRTLDTPVDGDRYVHVIDMSM